MTPATLPAGAGLTAEALVALRQVALRRNADPLLAAAPGGFASKRKGQGQEVAETRQYLPGDDLRHIDRGTTARTGVMHVRQFQQDRDWVTLLVADFRPSMFWGLRRAFLSVAAAEALVLAGWRVVEEGGRVALLALQAGSPVAIGPRGRNSGMLQVIGGLVRAHEEGFSAARAGRNAPDLAASLAPVARLCPPASEVVIASGFDQLGDAFSDRLEEIERRRRLRLWLLSEAQDLPAGRYPVRLGDGRRLNLQLAAQPASTDRQKQVAGRETMRIDAGQPVEQVAGLVATSLQNGAGP